MAPGQFCSRSCALPARSSGGLESRAGAAVWSLTGREIGSASTGGYTAHLDFGRSRLFLSGRFPVSISYFPTHLRLSLITCSRMKHSAAYAAATNSFDGSRVSTLAALADGPSKLYGS